MASPPAPPLPVAPCFHTTDELMLYELAVTAVDHDIDFIDRAFREAHGGRGARHLREDFCGTALLASEWVLRDARRTAVGVDTCARTLEWGRTRNVERVADVAAARADGDSAHAARDALLERISLVRRASLLACGGTRRRSARAGKGLGDGGAERGAAGGGAAAGAAGAPGHRNVAQLDQAMRTVELNLLSGAR